MTHVAVIGAGLQGATVALELARRGADVTVFEAAPEAVSRASRWNEGKLHLGYIFAKDAINRTARLLIDGATRFAPVLERHIPASSIEGNLSAGFHYLVMPDSLLDHAALGHHYAAVTSLANEALGDPARRYPGGRQTLAVRPLTASENARYGNGATGYLTDEIAVDAVAIAEALCGAMDACPRVDLVTNARVQAVERAADALFLDVNGSREGPFDHVVNASWEGRLALDATLGIHPSRGHVWRLKRAVQIRRPDAMTRLPTVTMVIGPYGDIVPYPDGRTYLSWYPVGCISRSSERAVPGAWEAPHSEAETARLTRD
ncbi:MAG: FAD-dependent oxidoreductase, partial [Pseudomonadota bacterium]